MLHIPPASREDSGNRAGMHDRFTCFAELASCYREGADYRILCEARASAHAIVAPHGGWIERGTRQLALTVAGEDLAFYCFEGLNRSCRRDLHITSSRFDEPRCLALVAGCHKVITIHGAAGSDAYLYAGGRDHGLRDQLLAAARQAGIPAEIDPSPSRAGLDPANLCNRGRAQRGVQLELTVGLRKRLFHQDAAGTWQPGPLVNALASAIRGVLLRDAAQAGFR